MLNLTLTLTLTPDALPTYPGESATATFKRFRPLFELRPARRSRKMDTEP